MSKKIDSKWEEKRLGDVVKINPETLSTNKYSGDIQYIDISSVNQGILSGYKIYEISEAPSRAKRIVKPNDIIYSTVRPNLKAYYYFRNNCPHNAIASTGFVVIRSTEKVDSRFIYYMITENSFVNYLSMVAKGSAYPAVDANDFKKARIKIPSFLIQQKIADILSTYDELIENNNRRIELLEKVAENLYKEWFVRFRFPDYKKTKFENGLPKGWKVVKLGELFSTMSGGTPSRKNESYYINGNYQWIKTGELNDRFIIETEEKITEEAIEKSSAKLFQKGSLLMAMYGATIGKLGFATENATCNQACCVLNPRFSEYTNEYLFLYLLSNREYITNIGFGAAQQNLSQDLIKNIKLLKSDSKLVNEFSNIIKPIYIEIRNLQTQNRNLIKQRDLLLPRLMSGKLEI